MPTVYDSLLNVERNISGGGGGDDGVDDDRDIMVSRFVGSVIFEQYLFYDPGPTTHDTIMLNR